MQGSNFGCQWSNDGCHPGPWPRGLSAWRRIKPKGGVLYVLWACIGRQDPEPIDEGGTVAINSVESRLSRAHLFRGTGTIENKIVLVGEWARAALRAGRGWEETALRRVPLVVCRRRIG